jgi:hypothetical protein
VRCAAAGAHAGREFGHGGGQCSGVLSIDFNGWIASGIDPALVAGQHVAAQFWYRDPQSPSTTGPVRRRAVRDPVGRTPPQRPARRASAANAGGGGASITSSRPVGGMRHGEPQRVQAHARTRGPVARIADDRMAEPGEVRADLMAPSGVELDLQQRARGRAPRSVA